jgi:hypothetical protein
MEMKARIVALRAATAVTLVCAAIAIPIFSSRSNAAPPPAPDLTWVKFQDPFEQAFTVDVPQGWTVRGGLFRLGYSDYRPMLDLVSADGSINIRSGDVAIPTYFLPTPTHQREGEVADLGAQAQGIYARYHTGKDYAGLYALAHFKTVCQTLTPEEVDQTPPGKKDPNAQPDSPQNSAGAIGYRCDSGGKSRDAYVYARTVLSSNLWQVKALVSYVAPANQVPFVRSIILHVSETFQVNPKWVEYQNEMDKEGYQYQVARQRQRMAELGQQVQQFEGKMQAMRNQVNAFERHQAAQQAQFQSWDNAFVGLTPTVDPLNGDTRLVWTGPKNGYWVNGVGTVVNSNDSPGPGFHQLQPQ